MRTQGITLADITLGNAEFNACPEGDVNHDGQVTIDEILVALNHALNGVGEAETGRRI